MSKEYTEKEIEDFFERIKNPDTKLTEKDLQTLKERVRKSLAVDLSNLLTRQSFISSMAFRFDIIPVRDYRVSTAQTDGTRIFFDIDFYSRLSKGEREFVIAHEVWHNIFLHFLRRQGRDPDLWNIATDCEINQMLKGEGFSAPDKLCFPPKGYEDKNAEDIYEYYMRKMKSAAKKAGKSGASGGSGTRGNGSGQTESSSGSGDGGDDEDGRNEVNRGKSKNGRLEGQFDRHSDKEDPDGNGEGDEKSEGLSLPKDKWGEKGRDSDYRPSIAKNAADKIRRAIVSEAQRYERMKGTLPGNLRRILDTIYKPEISWREHLSQFVTSCFGDRRQWLPPQRRSVWSESYFQSRRGEKINVSVIVDTSGSCTEDIPKFLTELVGLLNTFGRYTLTLVQCDAEVQSVETYDDNNPFPLEHMEEIEWKGFGGSDLNPAFKELERYPEGFSCNIVFTDGYIDCPKKNPLGCDTLFILTKDGSDSLCDWGKKIRFKESPQG